MAPVKSIKVEYNGELRRFAPELGVMTFAALAARVRTMFSISEVAMPALSYRDEDGDLVRISGDDELELAWRLHREGVIPSATLRIVAAARGKPGPAAAGTLAVAAPAVAAPTAPPTSVDAPVAAPVAAHSAPVRRKKNCGKPDCAKCAKKQARFVKDVTVEKGQTVEPGAAFTKIWRFRNEGATAWSRGTHLLHLPKNSDDLGGPSVVPLAADEVLPGQEIDVAADLTAPSKPGRYMAYYRLYDPVRDKKFGQRVWVEILVVSGSSSSDPDAWEVLGEGTEKKPKKKRADAAPKAGKKSKAKHTSASSGSSEDEVDKPGKKTKSKSKGKDEKPVKPGKLEYAVLYPPGDDAA